MRDQLETNLSLGSYCQLTVVQNGNDHALSRNALVPDRKNVYIQVLFYSLVVLLQKMNYYWMIPGRNRNDYE